MLSMTLSASSLPYTPPWNDCTFWVWKVMIEMDDSSSRSPPTKKHLRWTRKRILPFRANPLQTHSMTSTLAGGGDREG